MYLSANLDVLRNENQDIEGVAAERDKIDEEESVDSEDYHRDADNGDAGVAVSC